MCSSLHIEPPQTLRTVELFSLAGEMNYLAYYYLGTWLTSFEILAIIPRGPDTPLTARSCAVVGMVAVGLSFGPMVPTNGNPHRVWGRRAPTGTCILNELYTRYILVITTVQDITKRKVLVCTDDFSVRFLSFGYFCNRRCVCMVLLRHRLTDTSAITCTRSRTFIQIMHLALFLKVYKYEVTRRKRKEKKGKSLPRGGVRLPGPTGDCEMEKNQTHGIQNPLGCDMASRCHESNAVTTFTLIPWESMRPSRPLGHWFLTFGEACSIPATFLCTIGV
jgi:hypothetical protein